MRSGFSTYRKFIYKDGALELVELLQKNSIDFDLKDNSLRVDSSFGASENNAEFEVQIDADDFKKVEELEEQLVKEKVENVEKDYYLFEYSNEELIEIVLKKEEWNKFDYLLAQKILKEKGREINPELINVIQKQRVEDLSRKEASPTWLIVAGYFFSLLGGVFGLLIGLYLMRYKRNLPNGEKVYGFEKKDRNHGQNIFVLSIIGMAFWFYIRLKTSSY